MKNKLKPCPFCGSKNLHYQKPFGTYRGSSVVCIDCGATINAQGDKAVDKWNRRAEAANDK